MCKTQTRYTTHSQAIYVGNYDKLSKNPQQLLEERISLEAINQRTGERTLRHIGYLFDILFKPTVIGPRRIPVAVYGVVKKRVMEDTQGFAVNYVDTKLQRQYPLAGLHRNLLLLRVELKKAVG